METPDVHSHVGTGKSLIALEVQMRSNWRQLFEYLTRDVVKGREELPTPVSPK